MLPGNQRRLNAHLGKINVKEDINTEYPLNVRSSPKTHYPEKVFNDT